MTIFETRYASLISELNSVKSPFVTGRSDFYASLGAEVDGRVIWDSPFFLHTEFEPRIPMSILRTHVDVWFIVLLGRTFDGLGEFRERFNLIVVPHPRVPQIVLGDLRFRGLSDLRFPEDLKRPAFERNTRMTPFGRHTLRMRVISMRRRYFLESFRNLSRKKRILPSPVVSGPVTESRLTNFVRQTGNTVVIDDFGTHVVTVSSRSSSRVSTPNFKKLKRAEYPVNPYTMEEVKTSTRQGVEMVRTVDQSPVTSLSWTGPTEFFQTIPAPDYTVHPASDSRAHKALLAELDKALARESSQVTANIVQYRQCVNMIAKSATSLFGAYKAVKRLDFKAAERHLFGSRRPRYLADVFGKGGLPSASRSVSQNWLALQYGWKPLLLDIKNTVDSLHRDYHGDIRTVRGAASTSTTTEVDLMGPQKVSLATVSPFPVGKRVVVRRSKVEYGLRFKISDQDRLTLAQTGFLSPVSLAWEILPFSFVVDWFYPIGPYLESLAAFEGMAFVDGYKTTFVREQTAVLVSASDALKGTFPQRVLITAKAGLQRQAVKMVRTKLTTFPSHPRVMFKNPISVAHAQNAVALLVANWPRH